ANLSLNTDAGQCSRSNVTYSATVTDNCPGASVICTPASGSTFAKGINTVTCIATDAAGNTNTCSFTVTINDNEAPIIACPADIVTNAAPTQCSQVVQFAAATATDHCPGVTVSCNPTNGSVFPIGTNTVTCTATDTAG